MADITKCYNFACPLQATCYRAHCEPEVYQSYSLFYYDELTQACEDYLPIGDMDNED